MSQTGGRRERDYSSSPTTVQEEREKEKKKGDSPAIGAGLCRSAEVLWPG